MRLVPLALLAMLPSAAPQEPTVDEIIGRIEARYAAIDALAADFTLTVTANEPLTVSTTTTYKRGGGLLRQVGLWTLAEGALFMEEYFDARRAAYKAVFFGDREGGFFLAARLDPVARAAVSRGMLDMLGLMIGTDFHFVENALHPRRLKALHPDLQAVSRPDAVGFSASRQIGVMGPAEQSMTMTWLFNRTSLRPEKLEISFAGQSMAVSCEAYETIGDAELPSAIRFSSMMGLGRGGASLIRVAYRRADEFRIPAWVDDPALPAYSDEPAEAHLARLQRDPESAALAMGYVNALGPRDMMAQRGLKEAQTRVLPALEKPLAARSDSPLLNLAAYCAARATGDEEASRKVRSRVIDRKVDSPEIHALALLSLLVTKDDTAALEAADRLPATGVYGRLARTARTLLRAASARTAADLVAAIDAEHGKADLADRLPGLDAIESPAGAQRRANQRVSDRGLEFVAALAASDRAEARVLAARAYARLNNKQDAAGLYLRLATDAAVRSPLRVELQAFCREAPAESESLVEAIFEELDDPQLLTALADRQFEAKGGPRLEATVKKLIESLRAPAGGAFAMSRWQMVEPLKGLLRKLVDGGRRPLALDVLVAFGAEQGTMSFLLSSDKALVKKVLGDDKESAYLLARGAAMNAGTLAMLDLSPQETLALAKKRLEAASPEAADAQSIARFVADASLRSAARTEDLVSLLERAVRFHPKLSDVSESLGDLHALEGRFDRAAAAYQDSLKTRKGAPPASSNAMKAIAVASVAVRRPSGDAKPPAPGSPGWTFSPEAPFLIKLTYALLKQNDRDGAVRAVEQQLKEATDDDSITAAVEALDMVGLSERGLDVRRRQFLKRLKTTAMFPHLKEQLLAAGLDLGQRYLAASRFEEAYAITLYLSPDAQNKDSVKQFEELRAKAHAGFGEEALLRATAGGEVLPAEKAGAAKALIGKLDDDSPLERESAAAKLLEMGAPILPLVVEAVKGAGPEAAAQLKAILSEISGRELKKRFESK